MTKHLGIHHRSQVSERLIDPAILLQENQEVAVVIRASDTDIAVILLYHCEKFSGRIWMDVGTTSQRNRRLIDLTALSKSLGPQLCSSLPAFHAFTGSDYTAAFVRKGRQG